MKLLVVDDSSEMLEYMHRVLTHWGHEVLALRCYGEDEAAEILEVGFNMPGVLGTTLAVHIKKLSPSTKVIMFMEPVPPEEADWLRRQGVEFEQLPAPFEKEELLRELGAL